MEYIKIEIFTSIPGVEVVTAALLDMGITESIVESPLDVEELLEKKNEYDWDYVDQSVIELGDSEPKIVLYFEKTEENKALAQEIKLKMMFLKSKELEGFWNWELDLGRLYVETSTIEDSGWKDGWKEFFKPKKITDSIVVKPTWEVYDKKAGEIILEIDPQTAFGTGTHETTSLCLRLLEKQGVSGKSVLDLGTGSGILAIAAGLLGARDVLATDIDPEALKIASENVESNRMDKLVKLQQSDLTKGIDFKADIVLANLIAELVKKAAADVKRCLNQNGVFISSGILTDLKEDVAFALKESGFEIIEIMEEGEWCAIAAKSNE